MVGDLCWKFVQYNRFWSLVVNSSRSCNIGFDLQTHKEYDHEIEKLGHQKFGDQKL